MVIVPMGMESAGSGPSRMVCAKFVGRTEFGGMVVLVMVLVLVLERIRILRLWFGRKRRTAMSTHGLEVKKALASHRVQSVIYHCLFRGTSIF